MRNNTIEQIRELTGQLNRYRYEYYNLSVPTVSDAEYDRIFDQLTRLEKETGFTMSNSPTRTVGYPPMSGLAKIVHTIPLLSLGKTKQLDDLVKFVGDHPAMLMLKLDGLTVKLEYERGMLTQASTRGDGNKGEDITHNARVFQNIPLTIPHSGRLVITGEALIKTDDFERMRAMVLGGDGKPYKTSRNLAAGSVRLYDPALCAKRNIRFYAFSVLEGFDGGSKSEKLAVLKELGFDICRKYLLNIKRGVLPGLSPKDMEAHMASLKAAAKELNIPIDGMVVTYDNIAYSQSLGSTGHHYRDGLAFKFEDETAETVFRGIEWTPSRFGDVSPVALFDMVEIDGTEVSRATLHNLNFIKDLELRAGCRILVSKRNMIIPHIEDNLDRGGFDEALIPSVCPCCGSSTRIDTSGAVETLRCGNQDCAARNLRRFVHFAGEKAMDIEGLSESALEKFIGKGWLQDFTDIYRLNEHEWEICNMTEGFGKRSWQRLWGAIQRSRNTTFERYVIAMDIPMMGHHASKELGRVFSSDINAMESAVDSGYDFTQLSDFGEVLHRNIHEWFRIEENRNLWEELQKMLNIQNKDVSAETGGNPFSGRTIVVTGTLKSFTRSSINVKIESLGARAGTSVSKNTDYLICGESAGSKLAKARELNIPILTERQFLEMAQSA
ncbi:MAG: NAD-dependent DNA ligase LigA [Peptococcaceae bacterium]|jgi:DNA ligase (NAD+)|nr:NAD-dependent DNA ligase LigA [Peptococcaceae bacterium]